MNMNVKSAGKYLKFIEDLVKRMRTSSVPFAERRDLKRGLALSAVLDLPFIRRAILLPVLAGAVTAADLAEPKGRNGLFLL